MPALTEAALRKRRGIPCASLTHQTTRVCELEGKIDQPGTLELAERAKQKLVDIRAEFMTHHLALIDVLTDEEVLQAEQDFLDGFDEELVTWMSVFNG